MAIALQWCDDKVTTANTTTDLTSGTIYLCFTNDNADTAGPVFLNEIVFRPLGTNVVSVGRIWINDGLDTDTAKNNRQIGEVDLPATTVSQTSSLADAVWNRGVIVPVGYRVYVTIGTTVAAGYDVSSYASNEYGP